MAERDWLLREPSGTVHVLQYVPTYMANQNRAFVLPHCWSVLYADSRNDNERERTARTALRRRLRPIGARAHRVTCLSCIALGLG